MNEGRHGGYETVGHTPVESRRMVDKFEIRAAAIEMCRLMRHWGYSGIECFEIIDDRREPIDWESAK